MNKKVSIIVPIYNVEKYLEKCITSILNQTYKNIEVLLINDGSTDNSGLICDEMKKKDPRIKVFHKKNTGVSETRNLGIKNSTGDFLFFVDPDDFIIEDSVEILYENLKKYNSDISVGSVIPTYDENYKFENNLVELEIWNSEEALKHFLEAKITSFFPVAKLFKKELFENHKFNKNYKLAEDALLLTEILLDKNLKIVFSSKIIYAYLQHKSSATKIKSSPFVFDTIKVYEEIYNIVIKKYPSLKKQLNERTYWSYFTVYDKILFSENDTFRKERIELKSLIRKNFRNIINCEGFTISRKISLVALMVSESLYKKILEFKNKKIK